MEATSKNFRKRNAILSYLQDRVTHPSAETIYTDLKQQIPDLSMATVYRNLTFFQETGVIQSVGVVKGQERFDGVTAPHSHFVCSCCGSVNDLPRIGLDPGMDRSVSEQYGFTVDRHELTFYGTCQNCNHYKI